MSAYSSQPPQQREQTFLRVKRRRNENPPSTIRLELLGGLSVRRHDENIENSNSSNASNNNNNGMVENGHNNAYPTTLRSSSTATFADSRHSGTSTSTSQTNNLTGNNSYSSSRRTTTAAAVWKRVEETEGDPWQTGGEKRCRVVDAVLEQDGRSTKRRKLTVLGEASVEEGRMMSNNNMSGGNHKKKNIYKVLDPLTRLVDDSLTMVHSGDRPAAQHYSFITTDPRLAVHARKWMLHWNRAGNLLHACAHWNDVELAHDLLQKSLTGLADAVDEDGRTPYEIAQMSDHQSVAEVLEAFGADTTNFVYDMFVPEEIEVETQPTQPVMMTMTTTNTELPQQGKMSDDDDDFNPLVKTGVNGNGMNPISAENPFGTVSANSGVAASALPQHPSTSTQPARPDLAMVDTSRLLELQGGVGYWTEEGELILEVEPHHMLAAEFGHEGDDNEDYEDEDDIDSNCEDYGGNDYPDEDESWEEEFLHEEPLLAGEDTDDAVAGQSGSGSYGDEYGEW